MHKNEIAHKLINPQVAALADQHGRDPAAVLEILTDLQGQPDGLRRENIEDVAKCLGLPYEHVQGIASFYTMLDTDRPDKTLRLCDSPACWLAGAPELLAALQKRPPKGWVVERSSCLGLCDRAPSALVGRDQAGPLETSHLKDLTKGWRGHAPDYTQPRPGETRVLLEGLGKIDPASLDSARAHGAYQGLQAALTRPPAEVIREIESAGLVGRGGAGFPTGRKWSFVAGEQADQKYIICNADESEPLAIKDRLLLESNPHLVLEGMALAGYAVGASEGIVYIRGEYAPQADLLETAIAQAEEHGWLGRDIQRSGFSFHIHVHRGAGAYICGEETALLESLEGKRGQPRLRPPYPTTHGYRGKPTVVNNVETLAKAAQIARHGAAWYRGLSSARTTGTKIYAVLGHVNQPGIFEAPFGLTLRQIIDDFGGGLRQGSAYHFTLAGGAAGRLVPERLLDVPIDYQSGVDGIHIGVGAFLVCDQAISPVALTRELFHFFEVESCGKCTPCRVGTRRVREILDAILAGHGQPAMLDELKTLAEALQNTSFCGLGVSAAWPLQSLFEHFETELRSAIK